MSHQPKIKTHFQMCKKIFITWSKKWLEISKCRIGWIRRLLAYYQISSPTSILNIPPQMPKFPTRWRRRRQVIAFPNKTQRKPPRLRRTLNSLRSYLLGRSGSSAWDGMLLICFVVSFLVTSTDGWPYSAFTKQMEKKIGSQLLVMSSFSLFSTCFYFS